MVNTCVYYGEGEVQNVVTHFSIKTATEFYSIKGDNYWAMFDLIDQ